MDPDSFSVIQPTTREPRTEVGGAEGDTSAVGLDPGARFSYGEPRDSSVIAHFDRGDHEQVPRPVIGGTAAEQPATSELLTRSFARDAMPHYVEAEAKR